MTVIPSFLTNVVDPRQARKVVHSLPDIILIVFFAHLTKCETWEEIYVFAERDEFILKQVIPLENGLPLKDTIWRVMQVIHPDVLNEVNMLWTDLLAESNRQATGKLIAIDGKTMCGNHQNETKPLHNVSAYSVEDGICFGQTAVEEKSNEIMAIPKLLSNTSCKIK